MHLQVAISAKSAAHWSAAQSSQQHTHMFMSLISSVHDHDSNSNSSSSSSTEQPAYDHVCACAAGGTVLKLGTARHHQGLLRGIDNVDDIGCFALTELGFGEH
jgi:hypothetical protein